jgi:hypothetical protein
LTSDARKLRRRRPPRGGGGCLSVALEGEQDEDWLVGGLMLHKRQQKAMKRGK